MELRGVDLPPDFLHLLMLDSGWAYMISQSGGTAMAVFVTGRGWLRNHKHVIRETICHTLKRHPLYGRSFAESEVINIIGFRDARTSCRQCLGQGNWLPIGDAAFALNPVTGSGLTRSIASAIQASDTLSCYLKNGDRTQIDSYVHKQQLDFGSQVVSLMSSPYLF
jgi:flavin-dependent dehydrogenase